MAVTDQSPFKLVADVTVGTTANAFQFTVNGLQAAASVDTSVNAAWNMGYANSANDKDLPRHHQREDRARDL